MDPITAGAAAGAGGLISGYFSSKNTKETNEANAQMAREQMAFQERMSNTAHQREASDLEAAGLNRILSATGGSGASAPGGASATMQSPGSILGSAISDGLNTGMSMANMEADLNIKDATVAKTLADTMNSIEQNKVIGEDIRGRRSSNARAEATFDYDVTRSGHEAMKAQNSAMQSQYEADRSRYARDFEKHDLGTRIEKSNVDREFRKVDKVIDTIGNTIDNVTSAISLRNLTRPRSIKPGTRAEKQALEKAGRKGVKIDN